MQFRYDFVGDKLDLSRMIKQINRHLIQYDELNYDFYVLGYKIQVNINRTADISTTYIVSFTLSELKRDQDGDIFSCNEISVTEDLRFNELSGLIKYYQPLATSGYFESNSITEIINILSGIIKIIYKINNLKVFL
jgi:hypothetical protein